MARSVQAYLYDPETTEAERALIAACREGEPCVLNGGKLPAEEAEGPKVRAALIRLLAVEATSLHEKGVWLVGAVITGELDLSFVRCRGGLLLEQCRFHSAINILQSDINSLALNCSYFPALCAQGVNLAGSALLRGVQSEGTVSFDGARIGGNLSFKKAKLGRPNDDAKGDKKKGDGFYKNQESKIVLTAQGANVTGSLFLMELSSRGTVKLTGSQIGGQLACDSFGFEGKASHAFIAQSVHVNGGFCFREVKRSNVYVDLASAHLGDLVDDAKSWKKCNGLNIAGLTYNRVSGNTSPKTFTARKEWLEKGSRVKDQFFPQLSHPGR